MKIKTYLDLFGTKIPSTDPKLPDLFFPSQTGWISYAQLDLGNTWSEGTPENKILSMVLSEELFQEYFGSRKLPNSYKLINNAPQIYGKTTTEAKKMLMPAIEDYIKSRMEDWKRMLATFYAEYPQAVEYYREEDITDTLTKTGTETNSKTGTEANTRTGSVEDSKTGKEVTTPKGTETVTVQNNQNGYNSDTSVPVSDGTTTTAFDQRADELSFDQRKDTTTYNQLKDEVSFTNRADTLSFTDRADTNEHDGTISGFTNGPQKIILAEMELRKTDLQRKILEEIADHFLLAFY